ncbi:MAG: methyltransferase domain-containing protein [Gammaproteobacteria bacterium]|nr:methyltransferase domain-containing protein [Gammaproteobacteria bacterium]MCW8988682.1 methyltransferase domain-containing protein [Gammaproteobacteria bacterium]MCW9031181.1 methyltransferase domain-containing protein [Gammaproteobacteria bacterium]
MAILWQKTIKNTRYEVRTAGQTRRLYTDGVFHSQFNPEHAVTGGVWDVLMLPAFFYPAESIQRVLVLGVGGGAVIHQLQRYIKPAEIIGIELNPVHLMLAKQHFGITNQLAKLIQADAVTWLNNYSGPPFDMIIEDLFGEKNGEPERAVKANKAWFEKLNSHLSPEGVLVMNFISNHDLKNCAAISYKKISSLFKSTFQFTLTHYDNAVGAFLKTPATSQMLRKQINEIDELKKSKKLDFHVRKLK